MIGGLGSIAFDPVMVHVEVLGGAMDSKDRHHLEGTPTPSESDPDDIRASNSRHRSLCWPQD